ncbi:MAG: diaminopimelate epimerase [Bacteroidales bacterium]|nr:diaminopimelate epimerase [Bacteroidales bacterium]
MQHTIEFTKMHGAGNDYIYVDTMRFPLACPEHLSVLWSDRHKGIGGDGLVLIGASAVGDFSMRIFNNDGSEARMCGNASRCIGKYLHDHGLTERTAIRLETLSGIKVLHLHLGADGRTESVTVDMDVPALAVPTQMGTPDGSMTDGQVTATDGRTYTGTFVSMGNPHFVIFTTDVEQANIAAMGRTLEFADIFPERCNIEFAEVRPDSSIRMRVWERGSGITMACGTGACATAVAAALTGRAERRSDIVMDGGTLHIEWNAGDGHVYMTGPATEVFTGTITYEEP